MNKAARIILVFLGLVFLGGALLLVVANYNLLPALTLNLPRWADQTVILATAAVLFLIAVILISLGLRTGGRKPGNALLKGSEFGEVLISITAVENMVLRVIQQTQGIKDVSRQVTYTPDGLVVNVKIRVMPDISLPGLVNDLQNRIKEYLEDITGVTVHEVKVLVENIIVDQAVTKK